MYLENNMCTRFYLAFIYILIVSSEHTTSSLYMLPCVSSMCRLLEEEFEKREELERLKEQQETILQAEREQKAVLESDRKEQERLLAEAHARLQQLECDKAAAAGKMQVQYT